MGRCFSNIAVFSGLSVDVGGLETVDRVSFAGGCLLFVTWT